VDPKTKLDNDYNNMTASLSGHCHIDSVRPGIKQSIPPVPSHVCHVACHVSMFTTLCVTAYNVRLKSNDTPNMTAVMKLRVLQKAGIT